MIVVVSGSKSKTEPGGGNCANRRIFSRCCLGKALKRSGGSNFAIEIAPAVAVATTTAAFAATVAGKIRRPHNRRKRHGRLHTPHKHFET